MDGGGSNLQDSSSLGSISNDKPTVDIHPSPGCIHLTTGQFSLILLMIKNAFQFHGCVWSPDPQYYHLFIKYCLLRLISLYFPADFETQISQLILKRKFPFYQATLICSSRKAFEKVTRGFFGKFTTFHNPQRVWRRFRIFLSLIWFFCS